MVATLAAHQLPVESGQSSLLVQWFKSWDTIGWQRPSDRTVVTGDWPRQTRSSLVVYFTASPPSSPGSRPSRLLLLSTHFYFLLYLFICDKLKWPEDGGGTRRVARGWRAAAWGQLSRGLRGEGQRRRPVRSRCLPRAAYGAGMPQRRRRLPAVWRAGMGREKRGGEEGEYSAGRRVVAVAGRGSPSEPKAPSGGRDQRPWAPEAGALLRVCSYRKRPCKTVCRKPPLISMRIYYPTGKSRLCFLLLNAWSTDDPTGAHKIQYPGSEEE